MIELALFAVFCGGALTCFYFYDKGSYSPVTASLLFSLLTILMACLSAIIMN